MHANSDVVIMYISMCFFVCVCVCAGAWRSHDNLGDPSSGAAHLVSYWNLELTSGLVWLTSISPQPPLQAFSLLKYSCWASKSGLSECVEDILRLGYLLSSMSAGVSEQNYTIQKHSSWGNQQAKLVTY